MKGDDAAARVAALFDGRFLRGYVRGKLETDPVYRAVAERLRDHPHPLTDAGCGVGILAFYLRESGFGMPVAGIDHDTRKIGIAKKIGARYGGVEFVPGDARAPLPEGRSVVMLDLLHYFTDDEQSAILENAASAIPPGGMAILRDALRDGTWRYRVTWLQECFSRGIGWLRAERLHFPRLETIVAPFRARGFSEEIVPLWGRTPFNNYLFVFRRPSSGMTNE